MAILAGALLHVAAEGAEEPSLTNEQELELRMFSAQLADPSRSAKTKAEAAELLVSRDYPAAIETVKRFLADSSNRPAQGALAEAIAKHGAGSPEFIPPLLAMLTGPEPSVRLPAARALVTYKEQGVTGKLIGIARDPRADKAVRLVAIAGLQRVLEKQGIDALVRLVADPDAAISEAAAESLAKLTNIRAFGRDAARWRRWWAKSKNKPATAWLGDLADSLAREKARLEDENARLRRRLATAMMDTYAATPAARQDALLMSFLKDPLADVRQVGVALANRRVTANGEVSDELKAHIRGMLNDEDAGVRRTVALLEATFGDPDAPAALLTRLEIEQDREVQQALLSALGQLREPRALEPVLEKLASADDRVAAAAASALARLAAAKPLSGDVRQRAVKTLLDRYAAFESAPAANGSGAALREAVLTAMGMVGGDAFVPTLRSALSAAAATVRLAAVKAVAQLGKAELSDALVPLAADDDRGVRQAVVEALGALNGAKHLETILQRSDPAAESDATVREKAWTVATGALAGADAATLAEVCNILDQRQAPPARRVQVGQMLVQALKAAQSPDLPNAQRTLAAALLAASRPAEAAPLLGEAYSLLAAADHEDASGVYLEWVDALLLANDPMVLKAMADPARADTFDEVVARVRKHLDGLVADGRFGPAALLGAEVLRQFGRRLGEEPRRAIAATVASARTQRAAADRKRVAQLVAQLQAAGAETAKAAAAELEAMGERAVRPLVLELRALAENAAEEGMQRAVLDVLAQLAPNLTGYDPKAPRTERLRRIEAWLQALQPDTPPATEPT